MRNRQPLKQIPVQYNTWEYLELVAPPEYDNYSVRAITNSAVAVAYRLLKQQPFSVFLPHRDSGTSKIPQHATDQAHALFAKNPVKRTTANLTPDNYRLLRLIAAENNINQQTAVIFCLKILRYYTDRKGTDFLEGWAIDRPSATGSLDKIPTQLLDQIHRNCSERNLSPAEYLEYLLSLDLGK